MSEIDLNAHLRGTIERFSDYLCKDLAAMPEEEAAEEANPGFRPALKTVAHCAMIYTAATSILKTGGMPDASDEQRTAFVESASSREKALELFRGAAKELLEAVDAFPAERWGDSVEGFFGPTMLSAASIAVIHTMYHDGQLNHLHLMRGDHAMHWF